MFFCTYVCIMYVCMYICMYVSMHVCIHGCLHVCLSVRMYVVCLYVFQNVDFQRRRVKEILDNWTTWTKMQAWNMCCLTRHGLWMPLVSHFLPPLCFPTASAAPRSSPAWRKQDWTKLTVFVSFPPWKTYPKVKSKDMFNIFQYYDCSLEISSLVLCHASGSSDLKHPLRTVTTRRGNQFRRTCGWNGFTGRYPSIRPKVHPIESICNIMQFHCNNIKW